MNKKESNIINKIINDLKPVKVGYNRTIGNESEIYFIKEIKTLLYKKEYLLVFRCFNYKKYIRRDFSIKDYEKAKEKLQEIINMEK